MKIGLELPDVAVDQWFGTPALKVRKKSFCRMWGEREYIRHGVDPATHEVLVVMCDVEEKPAPNRRSRSVAAGREKSDR